MTISKDPVCGMTVDHQSTLTSVHSGSTYAFCSPSCKAKFDQEPGRFIATPRSRSGVGGQI